MMTIQRVNVRLERLYFRVLVLTGLLLGLAAPLCAERITIATPSRGLFEFPVVVAMRKGFFKTKAWMSTRFRCNRRSGLKH